MANGLLPVTSQDGRTPLKIQTWSVKVYFDLTVNDKASFVAPVNFHLRYCTAI